MLGRMVISCRLTHLRAVARLDNCFPEASNPLPLPSECEAAMSSGVRGSGQAANRQDLQSTQGILPTFKTNLP